jgi:hypothetical protein
MSRLAAFRLANEESSSIGPAAAMRIADETEIFEIKVNSPLTRH